MKDNELKHSAEGVSSINPTDRKIALFMSTFAFTVSFAVWTIFAIVGIKLQEILQLNDTYLGILLAAPILTGSLTRLMLGIWTDQYGGRLVYPIVMIIAAASTWLLSIVNTYPLLLLVALGIGFAGGTFAVGIAYVSRWYPKEKQGTVLGIFGAGNVGAAITVFGAPHLVEAFGWQSVPQIYSIVLFITAILFWLICKEDPVLAASRKRGKKVQTLREKLVPLKRIQVWRFSLYYFIVFGAFVAISLWLTRYYIGTYHLDLKTAGFFAGLYVLPASIFRALGGWLSDKYGARKIMYLTFIVSFFCLFLMSYPSTDYIIQGIRGNITFNITLGLTPFIILTMILGFFMSIGCAAVYKHIPVYYPKNVGAVGGIVGLIGGLGGFILPIIFGLMNDLIGVWTSCFMLLTVLVGASLTWMHFAILKMEREKYPGLRKLKYLPELADAKRKNQQQQP